MPRSSPVPSVPVVARIALSLLGAVALLAGLGACGGEPEAAAPEPEPSAAVSAEPPAEPVPAEVESEAEAVAADDGLPVVVFLGDSLTAGYGLAEEQAWPALLEERFAEAGLPFRAVNAGVSGDTSAGGLARLDWVLRAEPDVVVVELGPNDGLRGLDLTATEANLRRIVEGVRQAGAQVLLVGMQIPPNYGPDYARRFHEIFPRLAEELDVPLVPFLLAGVGGDPELNLPDGIHPNPEGHERLAENVAPYLEPMVRAATGPGGETVAADAGAAAAGSPR